MTWYSLNIVNSTLFSDIAGQIDEKILITGAGSPIGVVAAGGVGQNYFDTTNLLLYYCTVTNQTAGGTTWVLTSSGGGGTVGPGTVTQLAYFDTTNTVASPTATSTDSLTWDTASKFLGVDNPTPQSVLHVGNNISVGTVDPSAVILGRIDGSNNVGQGATIFNGSAAANTASGQDSVVSGAGCTASGNYSHAEGNSTQATTDGAHSEGNNTLASGAFSHSEGVSTVASGNYSHTEGNNTTAGGNSAHASGYHSTANGDYSLTHGVYASDAGNAGCLHLTDSTYPPIGTITQTNEACLSYAAGVHIAGAGIFNDSPVTTVAGGTSGNFYWSMPEQGVGFKKLMLVFDTYVDGTGATITFPTAFVYNPEITFNGTTLTIATISTTQVVIPATTAQSGLIIIEGF